jgi:hypothetical protein
MGGFMFLSVQDSDAHIMMHAVIFIVSDPLMAKAGCPLHVLLLSEV